MDNGTMKSILTWVRWKVGHAEESSARHNGIERVCLFLTAAPDRYPPLSTLLEIVCFLYARHNTVELDAWSEFKVLCIVLYVHSECVRISC